jgi:hypothetical protein
VPFRFFTGKGNWLTVAPETTFTARTTGSGPFWEETIEVGIAGCNRAAVTVEAYQHPSFANQLWFSARPAQPLTFIPLARLAERRVGGRVNPSRHLNFPGRLTDADQVGDEVAP